jgi:hypothetical protein
MLGNGLLPAARAMRKQFSDSCSKPFDKLFIEFSAPNLRALVTSCSDFAVREALSFRLFERFLFDEQTLPFIASSGATKLQNNR